MTERRIAVGVDLGGTKIHSLVATDAGEVLGEDRCPTLAPEGPDAVIDRIVESLGRALERAHLTAADSEGVGISTPGPCRPGEGIVTYAPNLPGWRNIPLARIVSDRMGVPTVMENDAAAACYGEYRYGAGRGHRHLLYVTLGTGIGGGIIIDGKLYGGASGAAGEVGHIIVDDRGPACNCGGRGCIEALASGPAIARAAAAIVEAGGSSLLAELSGDGPLSPELVLEAARRGDGPARDVIERAGYHLGLGLASLLNSLNPDALILGGGLVGLGDLYLGPAIRTARERAFAQVVADVTISLAGLGERAGSLGAAALLMDLGPRP